MVRFDVKFSLFEQFFTVAVANASKVWVGMIGYYAWSKEKQISSGRNGRGDPSLLIAHNIIEFSQSIGSDYSVALIQTCI